ncbi:MAG: secondary thiamine-phosphate synthase enzyme YjbQ, partial [Pseudomonadota bacterium]|nr:secondary thiamine-phosphate synthase enzyme YjbQ [Pseudomonadota bacterium]
MWVQRRVELKAKPKGFHLVTEEISLQLPELARLSVGVAHLFLQHTSASLSLNENIDPAVRGDMETYFNRLAPDNAPYFEHVEEGPDDMPAHLKSVILGSELTVPVRDGQLQLGIWQGIYLGEHRNRAA